MNYPTSVSEIDATQWSSFEPYFSELQARPLDADGLWRWLEDWSALNRLLWESFALVYIDKSLDTADPAKEKAFLDMVSNVRPQAEVADQKLKERLLALDIPAELQERVALMLRDLRNDAELFRDENVPLQVELAKMGSEYDKITGGMQAEWDGERLNLNQLKVFLNRKDRAVRERAWHTMMDLWLGSRDALNTLYADMLQLRRQVADNAGFENYRDYAFRERGRFDYTPEDCFTFHEAIEAVVVPAAERIYARKQARLGLDRLRPWDTEVDTSTAAPLEPYRGQDELVQGSLNIFQNVDPALARHFAAMAEENLLDLDTRAGKALGGYCSTLYLRKRPFIFMNGAGTHDDVQTMLHEAGHAFHVFETDGLPLMWQTLAPMEFCEVASMSMELLSAPYLTREFGGFYTASEAARARIEHLEGIITFLPYMAVVDAFQHWVYTHPDEAADATACDAQWEALWQRFMPGVDWTGLEAERETGWHRKLHIFRAPFYYIEYGMAQVGALQVWRNALQDQAGAVNSYREALALGGTQTLPDLFAAAGAEFRFDTAMLTDLVALIENTVADLEATL